MSTYVDAPREQQQVIGTVVGVVQTGPEKVQALVQPDGADPSRQPRKLWVPKDQFQTMIPYLQSQQGNRLAFLCNVSHWDRGGQPMTSLWIDQIGSPGVGSPAMGGPPQAQGFPPPQVQQQGGWQQPQQGVPQPQQPVVQQAPIQQGPVGDPKQPFIHRQTASKVAVQLLAYLTPEEQTMTNLLILAERLVAYYDNGLTQVETVEDLIQRAMPQGMEPQGQGSGGYQHGDDDIPF